MNVISFLISIHYYMILYNIILHIGCVYFYCCINFLSQLIENNYQMEQSLETHVY